MPRTPPTLGPVPGPALGGCSGGGNSYAIYLWILLPWGLFFSKRCFFWGLRSAAGRTGTSQKACIFKNMLLFFLRSAKRRGQSCNLTKSFYWLSMDIPWIIHGYPWEKLDFVCIFAVFWDTQFLIAVFLIAVAGGVLYSDAWGGNFGILHSINSTTSPVHDRSLDAS